jgi:hypothetical protein
MSFDIDGRETPTHGTVSEARRPVKSRSGLKDENGTKGQGRKIKADEMTKAPRPMA